MRAVIFVSACPGRADTAGSGTPFDSKLLACVCQTNGKVERFHETLKAPMNLLVYSSPEQLRRDQAEVLYQSM